MGIWSWIFPGEERQTLSELVKDHSCASGLIYSPLLSRMLFTGRRPDVLTRLLALTCCQDVLQTNVCMCLSLSWGPAHKRPLMSLHLSGKDVIMRTHECYWGVCVSIHTKIWSFCNTYGLSHQSKNLRKMCLCWCASRSTQVIRRLRPVLFPCFNIGLQLCVLKPVVKVSHLRIYCVLWWVFITLGKVMF